MIKRVLQLDSTLPPRDAVKEANEQMGIGATAAALPLQVSALLRSLGIDEFTLKVQQAPADVG